ncbi:long-chain-fatty-acid--CoA ligase [Bacillus sp. AGMB 02131]|uniref:Long-chain-fatty-acid--CoA ligase n=1 Tax=Peribacillus faecalis TaxID=2772559 RepID=A0A927HBF5_9BACI|nr:long-chain-fatty-acid--CoA ligase [Peribacillus faecalis]MBD3107348.1 long-chain-fatty-acid--CoA ligase [Peribacillus faecalis]
MNAYLLLNIPGSIVPEQEIIAFGEQRLTYEKLIERTGRLATTLSEYGVKQGDRIGFVATGCSEMVEVFFAAFQLGAVIVPINYRAKTEELAFMIQDSGVKVLVTEQRYAHLIAPILEQSTIQITVCIGENQEIGVSYEETVSQKVEIMYDFADVEDSELAILLYTSGTTNLPKGVMITHGQLTNYVMNHAEAADGTECGATIISVPSYHIAGATSICNAIYSGRRLVLLRQFDAGEWLHVLAKEKATHAFLVPTMLKRVMDHPNFHSTNLSSLKSLSYGAAPMPFPVIRRAIEVFPPTTEFANGFGMTETTSTVSVLSPEDHKLTGTPEEINKKIKRLASVGKPLPGVDIMVLDEHGSPVPANEVGLVYVRTQKAMKGYWNRPDASKETLVNGWVNTSDLGYLDEDGYLFLNGRSSDMIIRGGENISPAEIESVFNEHPEVADVAVIGIPSLEWGEEVMAVIVAQNPEQPPSVQELLAYCKDRLASFKRPTSIAFMSELPRTPTGKILKRDIKERYANNYLTN